MHYLWLLACATVEHCHHCLINHICNQLFFPASVCPILGCYHNRNELLDCNICICWTLSLLPSYHCSSQKAPHPQLPDASDVTIMSGSPLFNADIPFQSSRYSLTIHHAKSDRAPTDRWTWWSGWLMITVLFKSNKHLKNVLPGLTTVAACNWPAMDNNSRFNALQFLNRQS